MKKSLIINPKNPCFKEHEKNGERALEMPAKEEAKMHFSLFLCPFILMQIIGDYCIIKAMWHLLIG